MLDGRPLVDVHLHPARRSTIRVGWEEWARDFGGAGAVTRLYDADGTVSPARFDAYLAEEGVDIALVLSEYSPRVTGIQTVEDMLPLAAYNPDRVKGRGQRQPERPLPGGRGTAAPARPRGHRAQGPPGTRARRRERPCPLPGL